MSYRGHIENGVVVLDDPASLPEGTPVTIDPAPVASGQKRDIEGLWEDLNVDISEEDIDEVRREMWGNMPREDIL